MIGPGTEGLCWVAYMGFLEPSRTADLDVILARYTGAGCTIGYCPGPGPHPTECIEDGAGSYTCGGL